MYRYKLRIDGATWLVDPDACAVDPVEGFDNGLVIVGGTRPPLLFSSDRSHVALSEDGQLVMHLEVESGAPAPEVVEVLGAGQVEPEDAGGLRAASDRVSLGHVPLRTVLERSGRRFVRAEAAYDLGHVSPTWVRLGGDEANVLRLPRARRAEHCPPRWARAAVFYAIFVDRWHRGAKSPAEPRAAPRSVPSTEHTFYGGDLAGITEGLDSLRELGVDALVLTPAHTSPSPHRYDAVDLLSVDPALGGEEAFGGLVEAAHARGLRIIADVSVTHVNEAHPAFQSLLAEQRTSPYAGWFHVKRFPVSAGDTDTVACYPRKVHLPLLNLEDRGARAHALHSALEWVRRGVDGLRLDAVHAVPGDFWSELRAEARALNPELYVLGEVVYDRPARYAEERGLDAATDFAHRSLLQAFFFRGALDASEFWRRLAVHEFRVGPFEPAFRVLFLDTHDTPRALTTGAPFARLRVALTYLLLRPEPVWLSWGTEVPLVGSLYPQLEDPWSDRLPMPPLDGASTRTQRLVRQALRLRRELAGSASSPPALVPVETSGRLLAYDRPTGGGVVRVLLNAGETPASIEALVDPSARLVLCSEEDDVRHEPTLPPRAARAYRVR